MSNSTPGIELRDLLASLLFQTRFRLRNWEHTPDRSWMKKHCYQQADEAIRRRNIKDGKYRIPLLPVEKRENVRP